MKITRSEFWLLFIIGMMFIIMGAMSFEMGIEVGIILIVTGSYIIGVTGGSEDKK